MYVFGEIDKSSTQFENNVVNYFQNLTTASSGITTHKIVSGSISKSYWDSLNVMFYTSGSPIYSGENKFAKPSSNLSIQQRVGEQYLTKYHGYPSSSILQIPQRYYGERIKETSFKFTDLNNSDSSGNNPIIKDDGKGNLYSTNAHHSQSGTTSISSSDNYVGNIFYDIGVIAITETASFNGSVNYADATSGNYTLSFQGTKDIITYEYVCEAMPNELNQTQNDTIFSEAGQGKLKGNLTSSLFPTYISEIGLYDDDRNLMGYAKLSKPIPKSTKIPMRFYVRMDY